MQLCSSITVQLRFIEKRGDKIILGSSTKFLDTMEIWCPGFVTLLEIYVSVSYNDAKCYTGKMVSDNKSCCYHIFVHVGESSNVKAKPYLLFITLYKCVDSAYLD